MKNHNEKIIKIKNNLKLISQVNPIRIFGITLLFFSIISLLMYSNNLFMNNSLYSQKKDNVENLSESGDFIEGFTNTYVPSSSNYVYNSSIPQPNMSYIQLSRWRIGLNISWEPFPNQTTLEVYWSQEASVTNSYGSYEGRYTISLDLNQSEFNSFIYIQNRSYGNAYYFVKAQLVYSYNEYITDTSWRVHSEGGDPVGMLVVMERPENEFPLYYEWDSSRAISLVWACGPSTCISQSSRNLKLNFEVSDINETHFFITIQPSGFTSLNYTFAFGNETQEIVNYNYRRTLRFEGNPLEYPFKWNVSGTYSYEYCSSPMGITCYSTAWRTVSKGWSGETQIELPIEEEEEEEEEEGLVFNFPTKFFAAGAPPIIMLGITVSMIKKKK